MVREREELRALCEPGRVLRRRPELSRHQEMSDAPGLVRRAVQLRDLRRYAEAEAMFKDALAQSPHDPDTLHELALCQYLQPQGEKRAISTIESAIAAAPNESDLHATRALIL